MPMVKRFATCLATVAIVATTTLAGAQTQRPAGTAQPNPAAEHLAASRAALNKALNSPAPSGEAFTKLSELKTAYIAMEKAASTASPDWGTHYQTMTRLLTALVGPAPTSNEPGAVGTSGGSGMQLNPALAANLMDFRNHLTKFSGAMTVVAPAAGTTPAPATAAAPAAPPPPATEPPATAPPATPPASAPPATAPDPAPASAMPATADATVVAQLDSVLGMIESALKANPSQPTGTVSLDRTMLEQMKAQLEQIKASLKK